MKASWILPDGRRVEAQVQHGRSLMEGAVMANVPGVIGECGGTLSCATCHVLVDAAWQDKVEAISDYEDAMLDATEAPRQANSRLSCQIFAADDLDGIVLRVPGA
ncbi:MAG: 2Fe-2S iron-sulfur cluster binding domain-containing protein [Pararhodobacter sp.]|nr:2Fe-2S iron-sulfur cluster binding domain-containing protein [Pararhodobacter sp.]